MLVRARLGGLVSGVGGMGRTVLLSATMALALLLACGGVAQAIINGERDANDHPYVGLVYTGQQACTGTLISPRVVLTLGYCTQNWQNFRRTKVHVTFLQRARFDVQFQPEYSYAGVPHTHPQHGRPNDVGVVVLDEPVRTGDGYAKLPEAGLVEDLPHRADLDVVGYDIKNLTYCYGGSCGPRLERPGGGPAIRYNSTYEYVRKRDFDNPDYRSDLSYIKTSQASADQGREGICFFSYGIPYFLASDHRTIVALDSYFGAMDCTGTATAERIDRPAVLDWVRTFL